eukprot:GHVR01166009.1.p1 GENE.GHVR01166009.1~~GHVR01166009.1.p1  ORF type:complete len:538 (+),score=177.67 GHVR01166009.1:102-1715(+)
MIGDEKTPECEILEWYPSGYYEGSYTESYFHYEDLRLVHCGYDIPNYVGRRKGRSFLSPPVSAQLKEQHTPVNYYSRPDILRFSVKTGLLRGRLWYMAEKDELVYVRCFHRKRIISRKIQNEEGEPITSLTNAHSRMTWHLRHEDNFPHEVSHRMPTTVPTTDGPHFFACIGSSLYDRYIIRGVLGTGTFGRVFDCWDKNRNKSVAVKVVRGNGIRNSFAIKAVTNTTVAATTDNDNNEYNNNEYNNEYHNNNNNNNESKRVCDEYSNGTSVNSGASGEESLNMMSAAAEESRSLRQLQQDEVDDIQKGVYGCGVLLRLINEFVIDQEHLVSVSVPLYNERRHSNSLTKCHKNVPKCPNNDGNNEREVYNDISKTHDDYITIDKIDDNIQTERIDTHTHTQREGDSHTHTHSDTDTHTHTEGGCIEYEERVACFVVDHYCLVFERLGCSISQYINRECAGRGMWLSDICRVTRQIVRGLEFLHRHNTVHGDLKLQNIAFLQPNFHLAAHPRRYVSNDHVWYADNTHTHTHTHTQQKT